MLRKKESLITRNSSIIADAIKKNVKKSIPFEELEGFQKRAVLEYIEKNGLTAKALGTKWYNPLNKNFYTEVFVLDNDYFCGVHKDLKSFSSFEEFYNYCNGDIYLNSCFFGYFFNEDEIKCFNLALDQINQDAFIDYTLKEHTFKKLTQAANASSEELKNRTQKMIDFIGRCKITSLKELKKCSKEFFRRFSNWDDKYVFFHFLIKKYGTSIKEFILQYLCKYDVHDGLSFEDILFFYGKESAQYVIDNFVGECSRSTRKNRIREFKSVMAFFDKGDYSLSKVGAFRSDLQLYLARDKFLDSSGSCFTYIDFYFESFDEFANHFSGDLSKIDLSKAPISIENIKKYKIDSTTKLPLSLEYSNYNIAKVFKNNKFIVAQKWSDAQGNTILTHKEEFEHICDFVHYLEKDLSRADLLMCDGIGNLKDIRDIKWDEAKIRSDSAEQLGIVQKPIDKNRFKTSEFDGPTKHELETVGSFNLIRPDLDNETNKVSYITDIHLLHKFEAYKCKTENDANYVVRKIANIIAESSENVCLIGGDVASDFDVFKSFINNLKRSNVSSSYFFVLGNHELWPFDGEKLSEIVSKYKDIISGSCFHLLQNNLYYFSNREVKEISEDDLYNITPQELRERTRDARYIVFGGIGFSGKNDSFNANNGIYMSVLNRREEIIESDKFYSLYKKVSSSLFDRNVIVLTHMPMIDWAGTTDTVDGFIYVSGHNHRNYFFDNGKKRIYADNQVGYRGKNISLKKISADFDYDWFADYNDGIYEISKYDYEKFYRGIGEGVTFNREYEKLYLIKREKTYMFIMLTQKGKYQILNGGSIKRAGNHSLEYFYDNLVKYSKSVSLFLSKFDTYQKQISSELKKIGADGTIHGCIVDIDFYNHLYVNPLDGTVTPYFAYSMVDKYVYDNLPSLLKYQCPKIYQNYQRLIEQKDAIGNALIVRDSNLPVSKHKTYEDSTEMYKVSRILKGLQFTTKYNIVRLWNDAIVADASEENGRLIVSGIIDPDSMPKPVVELKPKVKIVREPKPKVLKVVLSEEEKIKIRDDKYKEKIMSETNGKVSCTTYRGSTEKADYRCNICGHEWSTRPDHFKDRQLYQCPACNGTRIKRTFSVIEKQEDDDEAGTNEKEVRIASNHENSGIKTIRKNEREKVIDSLVLSFIKDNNGSFSKQELFKKLVEIKGMEATITKNSIINSVSRLEEKSYVVVSSGKIFITEKGIISINKQ